MLNKAVHKVTVAPQVDTGICLHKNLLQHWLNVKVHKLLLIVTIILLKSIMMLRCCTGYKYTLTYSGYSICISVYEHPALSSTNTRQWICARCATVMQKNSH